MFALSNSTCTATSGKVVGVARSVRVLSGPVRHASPPDALRRTQPGVGGDDVFIALHAARLASPVALGRRGGAPIVLRAPAVVRGRGGDDNVRRVSPRVLTGRRGVPGSRLGDAGVVGGGGGKFGTFPHVSFQVKTPIDDSRYGPRNQSNTRE
jgi:hypothetical protein